MTNIFNSKSQGTGFKTGMLSAALCLLFAQTAWADNVLKDVKAATQADGKTAITLQFAEPVGDIQAFSTDNPPRIAIDLPETSNAFAQRRLQLTGGAAKSVNTVESGGRTRVVVDLTKTAQYRTQAVGNTLVLTLDPKSAAGKRKSEFFIGSEPGKIQRFGHGPPRFRYRNRPALSTPVNAG